MKHKPIIIVMVFMTIGLFLLTQRVTRISSPAKEQLQAPYLGIRYRMIPKEIARMNNKPEGAYVVKVENNSLADQAGIESGDIVVGINKQDLIGNDLSDVLSRLESEVIVEVLIDRDGEIITLNIPLKS